MSPSSCLCGQSSCSLKPPPGRVGFFGDKSIEFVRDPLVFIESHCEKFHSRVFLTRLALKHTLVIADYKGVTDFLTNNMEDFYNGLKDNFSDLFGHSILFADPSEAERLRTILLPLFHPEDSTRHNTSLQHILNNWKNNLDCSKPVDFYTEFKILSLEYNLEMFMGVKRIEDEEFFQDVSDLVTTHWHGVMSVPFSVSVPFLGSGGFKKAMDAKEKLIKIIKQKLTESNSHLFKELQNDNNSIMNEELMYNHMLLFSCAMIPKGVASVLSMFLEMSAKWIHLLDNSGHLSDDDLECVLLEVIRMFPPFIGGLRVALRDTQVGPYHLPMGTMVHYSLLGAMRDPHAFLHPEEFLPGRWRDVTTRQTNLGFSLGPHDCIGRHFTMVCLMAMARFTLEHFTLSPPSSCPPEIKLLPVLRPQHPHPFIVQRKTI